MAIFFIQEKQLKDCDLKSFHENDDFVFWLANEYNFKNHEEETKIYDDYHGEPYCSKCHESALLNGAEEYACSYFCPHCGARMAVFVTKDDNKLVFEVKGEL